MIGLIEFGGVVEDFDAQQRDDGHDGRVRIGRKW